jgi:hypothetical protein
VGLERGPLSLVTTTEELLERESNWIGGWVARRKNTLPHPDSIQGPRQFSQLPVAIRTALIGTRQCKDTGFARITVPSIIPVAGVYNNRHDFS